MAATITPAEFAAHVDSDPRTVRKFLRTQVAKESQPGKGHRWELPAAKRELNKLTKQFNLWTESQAKAKADAAAEEGDIDQGSGTDGEVEVD